MPDDKILKSVIQQMIASGSSQEEINKFVDKYDGNKGGIVNFMTSPLVPQMAEAARTTAEMMDQPRVDSSVWEARVRGFLAGAFEGLGNVASEMTSPINLIMLAAGQGPESALVSKIPALKNIASLPAVQNVQRLVSAAGSGAATAEGGHKIVFGQNTQERLMGVAQMAGGLAALGSDPSVVNGVRKTIVATGRGLVAAADQPGFVRASAVGSLGAIGIGTGHPIIGGAAGLPLLVPPGMRALGNTMIRIGGENTNLTQLPSGARNVSTGEIMPIRMKPPVAQPSPVFSAENSPVGDITPAPGTPYGHGDVAPLTTRERMDMDPNLDRLRRRGDTPPTVTAPKTPNQPPEPPTGAAAVPDTPPSPLPGDTVAHMGGKAAEMGDAAVTDMRAAGMNVPKAGVQSTRDIDAMVAGPQPAIRLQQPGGYERLMAETKVPDDLSVVPGGGTPTSATASRLDLMDQFLATQGPKQSFVQPGVGEMTMDASGSHIAAPVTRATVAVPDEWLDAVANAAKGSKSKSKSFLASGLSANDVQQATAIYRADPTINPETAAQQLEMLRAGRHMNHYTNAQLSAFERQMLDREPDE